MSPADALLGLIRPALNGLHPTLRGENAERLLLSIALQESGLKHRIQRSREGRLLSHLGRGLWQFELTGVRCTVNHTANAWLRRRLYTAGLPPDSESIHRIIGDEKHDLCDVVAVWLARGLLWTDPRPLPSGGLAQVEIAYEYYCANWRPGRPHHGRWLTNWALACDTCDICRLVLA